MDMCESGFVHETVESSYLDISENAYKILREGRILAETETPAEMIERVATALTDVEKKFNTSSDEILALKRMFLDASFGKLCVMSTPILTNAGRYSDKPLSACTVPTFDLKNGDKNKIGIEISRIHSEGMGTGFCLDGLDDPVAMLNMLNNMAVNSAATGKEDRPVGNIATLSIHDPNILDFIGSKRSRIEGKPWKFNTSVNCD